jgi:hypothetical protein
MVAEPQPVASEAGRRREPFHMEDRQPIAKARQVVLERPEREVMQLLALAFVEDAPAMFQAGRIERQAAAFLAHIEAEALIEMPRLFETGHGHAEMIERVDAEYARPPRATR